MQLSGQLFLFCFVILIDMEECSNITKNCIFKGLRTIWSIFSRFWVGPGADHTKFCENGEGMAYSCVPNGFYFSLKSRSGGRSAQSYEEC